ncbi:MAG TPA: SMP-30/gluconolactonase/LRE family protein [Polyangiaceae bacterium]|nr:SMP-30/gluconolactonase/LRE family protein [Polyangiaceae bacterium]
MTSGDRVVEAVANYHCFVGENPLWNPDDGRIYWVDIENGRLFRADHASGEHECFHSGPVIGGFTLEDDGSLLLFEADRIARLERDGRRVVLREGIDPDMRRFNDVIADPEGRVFAGTIGQSDQTGGLYRVDLDGSITCVFKETGIANGMAFTRDLRRFFWTCSTTRRIFAFDYDRATGALANRALFHAATEVEGTPDGLTIDDQDRLWSARWGGFAVVRLGPDGRVAERVELPVERVSSCTFGGPELACLYVTTAVGAPGGTGADGTLYRVDVGARGKPAFRSRVRF